MASSSGTPGTAAAAGPASNQGAAFQLPPAQRWRWLCLPALEGQVTVRFEPGSGAPAPAAGEDEEGARVLALVRDDGVIGEWIEPVEGEEEEEEEEEDISSDDEDNEDGSTENGDEDEDARRPKKLLPSLALRKGGEEEGPLVVLETVGWSDACALTHALAHKAIVALAPLEVVHAKVARPRGEEVGAPEAPVLLHLTVRLRARLCLNEAKPRLCPEHRKGELPKLLRLANLLLLATAEDLPLPDRLLASRPRRRLAALFEEASAAAAVAAATVQPAEPPPLSPAGGQEDPLASSPLTARLADDTLGLVFSYFLAPELRALGQTCRFLKEATKSIVPGLKARLFPHQLRSLDWMLARETRGEAAGAGQGAQSIPHPAWEELGSCRWGDMEEAGAEGQRGRSFALWVNMTDGRLTFSAEGVPRLNDARSGILADEMGLGKTVTALALILKTRGLLPSPLPPAAEEDGAGGDDTGAGAGRFGGRFHFRSPQSRRREVDPRELVPSPATLVISPGPLLQHWKEQVALHCEPWALGLGRHVLIDDAVDEKGRLLPLPPAEELAAYDVVVVSKERLRLEWKTGRPACALEERRPRTYSSMGYVELVGKAGRLSPLLGVRWLRIVVDEGHSLGALNITHEIQMAKSLEAERRWAMTGTPHRHDAADLASLRELLIFLRQEPYGLWHDLSWAKLIGGGRGGPGGGVHGASLLPPALAERRLLALLRRVMIRHTKASTDIPRPVYVRTRLRMSRLEANTYNTLVSLVQANLLTTGLEGGSHLPGAFHPDSMLNPANKTESNTLLHNVRLACCGGGSQVVNMDAATIAETLNLARKFGCSGDGEAAGAEEEKEERLAKVATYLSRLRGNTTTACDACGVPLLILLITPCLHLLCCRCMRGHNNVCARCLSPFDVDEFQLLQPGLSIHWREDDVLALPPAVGASSPQSSAASAASMVMAGPSGPQQQGQEERKSAQGEEGMRAGGDSETEDEDEEQEADDGSWRVVTKAWHMITVLKEYEQGLSPSPSACGMRSSSSSRRHRLPLKAVVFSQFRSYLNGLAAALRSQGFRVGCFFDKTRVQDLTAFRDPAPSGLQVLLIGKEGSHGLDLSMATHLFIMDQIADRNLEDQVVSRAYRMGARGPCRVEFLSMVGTVEETMERLAAAAGVGGGSGSGNGEVDGDDVASVSSSGTSAVGSSMSSLSAHGRGSWEGSGGSKGKAAATLLSSQSQGAGKRKRRARLYTDRKRQSTGSGGGRSGTGAAGGGAEDMTKMHVLLQSLDLVEVPEIRRARRRVSAGQRLGGGASPMLTNSSSSGGGDGGQGATAAASAAASGSERPPTRRVRFAD